MTSNPASRRARERHFLRRVRDRVGSREIGGDVAHSRWDTRLAVHTAVHERNVTETSYVEDCKCAMRE